MKTRTGRHSASGYALRSVAAREGDRKSTLSREVFSLDNPGHLKLMNPITGFPIRRTWMMEQEHLTPLPLSLPEPFDVQVGRKVTRDCLVSFEGRQYEVPSKFVGRTLTVRGCPGEVRIYHAVGELLRVYPRGTACRLLLDRTYEDFEEDGRVLAPTPLGRLGREIVLQRSWEWDVPRRSIDAYHELVSSLS